jgi:hypothetical protein
VSDFPLLPRSEFVAGAQAMREMLSRFVEQDGRALPIKIANSMRLNWNPRWGEDPGAPPEGEYSLIEFAGDGVRALKAANIDGRFDEAIAKAEEMMAKPVITFTRAQRLREQQELDHDQSAFRGTA